MTTHASPTARRSRLAHSAHITRIALCACLAFSSFVCATNATAQDRARDLDPASAKLMSEVRKQDREATIQGSQGFLNYAQAFAPTDDLETLPSLFAGIANVEEPGDALLPYQSRGVRVSFDFATLDQLKPDQQPRVAMPLLDGEVVELAFVKCEHRTDTRYTWFGQIAGVAASDFILVRYDDTVFITLRDYQNKRRYEVQYMPAFEATPAGHTLAKQGDVLPPHQCGTCANGCSMNPLASTPAGEASDTPAPSGGGFTTRSAPTDPVGTIDVMVICTAEARAGYGQNPAAFFAQAEACIADMNLRHSNSGTGATMRLMAADWDAAQYNEDADGGIDLDRLAYRSTTVIGCPTPPNGCEPSSPDPQGFMDNIHSLRDTYRADLVALIRQSTWGNTLGVAYRPSTGASIQSGDSGFSVNARTGSLPLVGDIFAHELGHNLGACHDVAQTPPSSCSAVTANPHGKVISCDRVFCTDYWHTTMAYGPGDGCSASTLLPYWSNSSITYVTPFGCPNRLIGDSNSHVAFLILNTKDFASQARIAASRSWVWAQQGNGGGGTRYNPYGRVRTAVAQVQGGTAFADVQIFSGTYDETASNGGAVLLSNPCLLKSADGAAAIVQ